MKNTLTLILFLLISSFAYSQIDIHVIGGANSNKVLFLSDFNYKSEHVQRYFGGVNMSLPNYRNFKFGSELRYISKGIHIKIQESFGPQTSLEIRNNYIGFVPEIEYSILDFLSIGLGAYAEWKLSSKGKNEEGKWLNYDLISNLDVFDCGINGKVKARFRNFLVFARYNIGFRDALPLSHYDLDTGDISETNPRNTTLELGVGYRLGI